MAGILKRTTVSVMALAAAIVVVTPGTAFASCAEPIGDAEAIARAETVFVGRVVDTDFGGRLATFEVEEVWKGTVGREVLVSGGPSIKDMADARARGEEMITSVDRNFVLGETYLVVSSGTDGAALLDNACSNTQPFAAALSDLRPADAYLPDTTVPGTTTAPPATIPPGGAATSGGTPWAVPTLVTAAGLLSAAAIITIRRKRHTPEIW